MRNVIAGLLVLLAVGAAIPSFACGGGTSVSMFIDTKAETPQLPPDEVATPAPAGRTLPEVM